MEKKVIIFLLAPFLMFWHWFEPVAKKNRDGMQAYQEGKYDEALKQFLSAKGLNADLAELKNNTAASLYQMQNYKKALEEFSTVDPEKTRIPKDKFYYNLGNTFYKLEQYDKAVESYKKSLIENSDDMDAKKNFELALKKLQQQKQEQNQDKNQDKDKQKEKEEEKQQEQQQQQQEKEQQHQNIMQYLNQNEKEQMEKKKRKIAVIRKEKDW